MSRKILISIDEEGKIQADFIAFADRTCEDVEKRLRQELAGWGIEVKAGATPKTPSQIDQEIRQETPIRERRDWKITI